MDGVVDVWDYFYRQNEVAYSHKIGDCALSSISVQVQRMPSGLEIDRTVEVDKRLSRVCPLCAAGELAIRRAPGRGG
jgi:hypothetical protein